MLGYPCLANPTIKGAPHLLARFKGAAYLRLSPRQESIVRLIGAGLSDKQIATRLGLSRHTVRTHLDRLFVKHRIHNRIELLMIWMESLPTENTTTDEPQPRWKSRNPVDLGSDNRP
jgi:DNA-binding CsgD family transcriptional regulator